MDEGPAVIAAQKETGKILQVGSQGVSSLGNEKAKELLKQGAIGELNYAEGFWARRAPLEVWQYPIPADASAQTVDWDTYVSNTNKRSFDAMRFFPVEELYRLWHGMAGDLFVHLFSSLHFITSSLGPNKVYAVADSGIGTTAAKYPMSCWVLSTAKTTVHPGFNLFPRCNFVDGTSGTTSSWWVAKEPWTSLGTA
jgi:hypothetical protein